MTARQNFLALTAGAVGAGAVLPEMAVGAVSVPIGDTFPPDHPDAELIRLCAENVESLRAFNADPQDAGDDNPFWLAYLRTKAAISEAKPQTIEGMVAKAKAAKFQAIGPRGEEQIEFTCPASAWAWDLVNDLLRLRGEDVGMSTTESPPPPVYDPNEFEDSYAALLAAFEGADDPRQEDWGTLLVKAKALERFFCARRGRPVAE